MILRMISRVAYQRIKMIFDSSILQTVPQQTD